jgi:beta-galactosidase
MNCIKRVLTAAFACVATAVVGGGVSRVVTPLSGEGWRFSRDRSEQGTLDASAAAFDDSAWTRVEVPHDWAIEGPFDPKLSGSTGKLPWSGVGWYRRTFTLSPATAAAIRDGAALWLEFDGVMADAKVFINGARAGGWQYGYMSFRTDAAPFVREGVNVLAVRADTRGHGSRWYPGAGIYRDVRLVAAPAVHIVPGSECVTTPELRTDRAVVTIAFSVTNRLRAAAATCAVDARIDGVVGMERRTLTIPAGGSVDVAFDLTVTGPRLWDVDDPQLYRARLTATAAGSEDVRAVRFGIRTATFTATDGFYLNGRRLQLKGVNLHSDLGPLGMAFNRSAARRQLEVMKDMGVNALRTSHNACDPQVLELCDEMGIVVWNECFDKWNVTAGIRPGQDFEAVVEENLRAFVRRDRNHPCVIAWSIGNEIPPSRHNGMTAARFRRFRAAIRALDVTRPVGIGCCHLGALPSGMLGELDVVGWNYRESYVHSRARHPDTPHVYTESASAVSSYGSYWLPPAEAQAVYDTKSGEVDAYEHHSAKWSDIADLEFARMERDRYCAGEFVWTGIDYLGEPTPYRDSRSSYFGICDLTCLPKDRFWLYRAHWNTNAHTTALAPHWTWPGREGQNIPVYAYTDGDEAELFLNGRSLGRRRKGEIQKPVNLAAGCRCTASTEEKKKETVHAAALALDGKSQTRWCAATSGQPEWLMVDLGARKTFRSIYLDCEFADTDYEWTIEVSDDARAWREWNRKPQGARQTLQVRPETARYVRVSFTALKGKWASVREFVVTEEALERYRCNRYYDICDRYRLRWFTVPYEPGELKVVAYKNGVKTGEAVRRTAGRPATVRLTPEKTALPADGQTLCFVTVETADAAGTLHPLASNRIFFRLTGPGRIVAVCNGDARALESFKKTDSHPLYNGRATVVVRREKGQAGEIRLTASAEGLAPAVAVWR